MSDIVHEQVTFEIVGDHPHAGDWCTLMGESKTTVTIVDGQVLVYLMKCAHGVDRCYVPRKNLRLVHAQMVWGCVR